MTNEQPTALRLADELLDGMSDEHWNQLNADAAAMLRRQHATLQRALEALEYYRSGEDYQPTPASEAIAAIKERLNG